MGENLLPSDPDQPSLEVGETKTQGLVALDMDRDDSEIEVGEDPGGPLSTGFTEFNIVKEQEKTRAELAKWLVQTFMVSIGATFVLILIALLWVDQEKTPLLKDFLSIVLTIQSGLVGSAIGFYFGKNS
jgi:hypothetical protein